MGDFLHVVFTIRGNKIRVISARDMNRKERRIYYEQIEKGAKIQE
ncbi:MAG: BrnT family toxin [Nitrospirota bacterium]